MFVYAIGLDGQFIKFGISKHPLGRMKYLQGTVPHELKMLSLSVDMARPLAFTCERTIHTALTDFHVRREWFASCPKTLAFCDLMRHQAASRILEIARGWASQDGFIDAQKKGRLHHVPAEYSGVERSKVIELFRGT